MDRETNDLVRRNVLKSSFAPNFIYKAGITAPSREIISSLDKFSNLQNLWKRDWNLVYKICFE